MKRVIVIGSPGAGKSTFSKRLGRLVNEEVYHLDQLFWLPGWVMRERDEFIALQEEVMNQASWIIDGNYGGTLGVRLEKADTVIWIDPPRKVCLYRILKRYFLNRNQTRPDMTEGCEEKLDWEFIKYVWNFRRDKRPKLNEQLHKAARHKTIHVIESSKDMERFLENIKIKREGSSLL
ncbi:MULTISPECIES: DNA topology modulation protein [Pontibacillus]|uniref:DNA topology modulation protein n=1 Tax=Pontibacillus chungwhensis TaxID=265426 RepID=A0ABY8V1P2_9BACI|nr:MULTISPECIES: DNA topology modulation protein [Pontibacillus]MCD5322426.1 DNA topology modulation protein [Pontibacillus sp. HN14]WIF99712.1 DNA topology modulation protein [Pontibacillus chungwhensis]